MAWIESHQQLARHPKVVRLAGLLKINKAQAIGHLHLLWWWTLDYSPEGDLSAFTSCELAAAAEWTGDDGGFVKALKECRWLDADGRLHDWRHYAGRLLAQRERMRAVRAQCAHSASTVSAPCVLPDQTGPDRTRPKPTPPAGGGVSASVQAINNRTELERVERRIASLKADPHVEPDSTEAKAMTMLKLRRKELKAALGFKV